jgi:membrane-associated phospholipid phosphatase
LRSGHIVELHMSDTSERHLPYLVAILGTLTVIGLLLLFDGPELLVCLAAFNLVTLVVVAMVNLRWLISFHAAAAMAMGIIVTLVFGWVAGLLLAPVVALVFAVRLYLRRHTVGQVVAGLLLGAGGVLFLWQAGCFT